MATISIVCIPLQSQAASKGKQQLNQQGKNRLVLMPLRVPPEDSNLTGAMETALVEGLQQKYVVFSGEQVSQKAREIFLKETRNKAHKECDETKCMQNIAMAFQAELLATANITKQNDIYYLALSIQNIFDNKVEYSNSITCENCNGAQVIKKLKALSGDISSGAQDSAEDEAQKEAIRKQRAEQLKQEQQAFEAKLENADAAEHKRLLDAKAADDKRLAELETGAEERRKSNQAQPTTFPPVEQARSEINKLTEKISTIEAGYDTELADTRKQVQQRYSDKLGALDKQQRDEFDSASSFNANQDLKRNDLISQRDVELARLSGSTVADTETAPIKARIKALYEHDYIFGSAAIEAELGSYDPDKQQFSIHLRSKNPLLNLDLNAIILLQSAEARVFKQQWQTGLVRPEVQAKFNGELVEEALLNDADNSRLINYVDRFVTPKGAAVLKSFAENMISIPGKNYEMGRYDVTQAQWKDIMNANLSTHTDCGDNCPVDRVSWNDVQEFLKKLNAKSGKQYRLPTEKEWEYACYGGNKTEYCGGNDPNLVAWYLGNSGNTTHPVGQKQANGYGLYDMSGKVDQWMENLFSNYSPELGRAIRGGDWATSLKFLGAAYNIFGDPSNSPGNGFRLARTLP